MNSPIIDIIFYNNNTTLEELDDIDLFRRFRQYAIMNIELYTNTDLSKYDVEFNFYYIKLAIVYQIDYYRTKGMYIGQSSDDQDISSVHIGKVSISKSSSSNNNYNKRFSPLTIDILESIGLNNRQVFIKDNIY